MNEQLKIHERYPETFPEKWASDWGQDSFGLWMSFKYMGVRQCMRWIKPGSFMMGSSDTEPERFDNEILHEVILTKGFWMADTVCTQGLWKAVIGKDPSDFKGENNPVDSVNWEDCIDFLNKINDRIPGLDLRLPTEAEWEYSCRAGTRTPFSFGKNITTDSVNYNGDFPYAGGKKGENRNKTVPVKSLPCNDWGLYEMHGNIWEWCRDWRGDYTEKIIVDPKGPDSGDSRVLRGGSWIGGGRNVRSAFRNCYDPGYRNDFFGFRFARGQSGKSGR